jgi:hypothetical protein
VASENDNSLFSVRYGCMDSIKRNFVFYSDHGKQNAQEKWIALMQMTPTRLVFFRNNENAPLIGD